VYYTLLETRNLFSYYY